jgi:hypothetical protein
MPQVPMKIATIESAVDEIPMQIPGVAPNVSFIGPNFRPRRAITQVPPQVQTVGSQIPAVAPDFPGVSSDFPDISPDFSVRSLSPGNPSARNQQTTENESGNYLSRLHCFSPFTGTNTRPAEKFRKSFGKNFAVRRNFFPESVL